MVEMKRIRASFKYLAPYLTVGLLGALLAGNAFAQDMGNIRGVVVGEDGDPLSFVNVMVKQTTYGGMTDANGRFLIKGIPVGTYTLMASMIGAEAQERPGVVVTKDRTTEIEFRLEETVLEDVVPEIVVEEERPMIEKEKTSSTRSISEEDVEVRAINTVQQAIAAQPGVVMRGDEVHIRGGRSGEVKTYVDGIEVTDPFMGSNTLSVSFASLSEFEFISGGFDAEYGDVQSGIINIITREGGKNFSGEIKYLTDDFGSEDKTYFNYDFVALGMGGPLFTEKIRWYVSGEGIFSDTYLSTVEERMSHDMYGKMFGVSVKNRQENDYSAQGKLSFFLTSDKKLTVEHLTSWSDRDVYLHHFSREGYWSEERDHWWWTPLDSTYSYYNAAEHTPNIRDRTEASKMSWRHTLSPNTFYTANLGYFSSSGKQSVLGKDPWEYTGFSSSQNTDPANSYYVVQGDYPQWQEYDTNMTTFRIDVTSQRGEVHQLKGGWKHTYYDLYNYEALYSDSSRPDGIFHDSYHVFSNGGALYIQDKMRYEGMVVNLGLRFDIYDPGSMVVRQLWRHRVKMQLSPRLGIAYPISDRDALHFHYGRFYQLPRLETLYKYFGQSVDYSNTIIGNPFLEPETTIMYELGVKHQFTTNVAADVTAFYKDIFGLLDTQEVEGSPEYSPSTYVNTDYGSVRGIELQLRKRFSNYFSGSFTYTYSVATGVSSSENQGYEVSLGTIERKPLSEQPLDWDERHVIVANLHFADPGNWDMNADFSYGSGQPFTPILVSQKSIEPEQINTGRLPSWWTMNVKGQKKYSIYGQEFILFFEGWNIFDNETIRTLSRGTWPVGDAYYQEYYTEEGELGGAYLKDLDGDGVDDLVPLNDPSVYTSPRHFRVGIAFDW
jgi:outer membrane receptor protein involved in Fe transport